LLLGAIATPALAQTTLNDGATHIIDTYDPDWYWVTNTGCTFLCYPPSGAPTHVSIAPGGQAVGVAIEVFGSSTVHVEGGAVLNIEANDYAEVTVDSGTVMGEVGLYFGAKATVNGGTVESLRGRDFGETTITGGFVRGGVVEGSHVVQVTSGQYNGARFYENARVVISGSSGLHHDYSALAGDAVLEVVGSQFEANGQVVPYGLLGPTAGMLEGLLENDSSKNAVLVFQHNQPGTNYSGQVILVAGSRDADADMLDDLYESSWGGLPGNSDTDSDGLADGWEAWVTFTQVDDADTDGDQISDGDEVANGTDPLDEDDPGAPTSQPVPALSHASRLLLTLLLSLSPLTLRLRLRRD